jgi:hypothetical protein
MLEFGIDALKFLGESGDFGCESTLGVVRRLEVSASLLLLHDCFLIGGRTPLDCAPNRNPTRHERLRSMKARTELRHSLGE